MLGRYVVLQELGRGGMSVVYVAYDPELDRRIALKVVRGDKLSETHRARLHREAQALARLSHPNVVTVFDVGDLHDDTFVAMELVDGVSLKEWFTARRSWRDVVRVMVACGRGLASAHAAGILHRDVKPGNVMISTTGVVKLVDFGLARDLGDRSGASDHSSDHSVDQPIDESLSLSKPLEAITQLGHLVGTPAYMPPEQRARRTDTDERADQFSFCATLYEGLYRQRPFEVKRGQLAEEAPTEAARPGAGPRTLARPVPKDTDVPAWLARVVSRGLAIDPADRYPSVEALLVELDRDPARTRRRIALGAGAVVAIASAAALVTWSLAPSHAAAPPSCSDGSDRLASVWSGATKDEIAHAAAAREVAWAGAAVEAFGRGVDQYASDWTSMHLEACQATKVRGEQSEEALDLRMACLDRRLGELGALVTVMRDADKDALEHAGEAVTQLAPISGCADVAALRAIAPPPAAIASQVSALDGDLARLEALYAIGNSSETIALADRIAAEARPLGYAPPLARAMYWRGRAVADRDGGPEAEAAFDETFADSLAAGDDELAADAVARIAQEELWAAHLPEFARWEKVGQALAARTGSVPIALFVDQLGCMSYHFYGKVQTRLTCLRDLSARRDQAKLPSEWLMTTLGIAASEAGDLQGAIHWLERGAELSRERNGADHPRTLEMRAYLCHGLTELGDDDRAISECKDALDRLTRVAPDDTGLLTRLRFYLGDAEAELGRAAEARPLLEQVAASDDEELKVDAADRLGDLAGEKGDVAGAIAQHREDLAAMIDTFGPFNPHHPNIIAARHELGATLLAAGDVKGAIAELAHADGDADPTEMSPLEIASLRFDRARAVVKSDPSLAKKLAQQAVELYARSAPDTAKFRARRAAVDSFVAGLAK